MEKFKKGDIVYSSKFGKGVVKNSDPTNKNFHYDVTFEDLTQVWVSEKDLSATPVPMITKKKKEKVSA